jgi:hypothetical protein
MMMTATVERYHIANKGFMESSLDIVRKCDHSNNTSQHSLSDNFCHFEYQRRWYTNEHLVVWQMSDAPRNALVFQCLSEMQGLTSVVIAMICSRIWQSYAIKLQLLG